MSFSRVVLEIDTAALQNNFAEIRRLAGTCRVAAVIKANAYGTGDLQTGKILRDAGVSRFAAADLNEALRIRELGLPVQILGTLLPDEAEEAVRCGFLVPVTGLESAKMLGSFQHSVDAKNRIFIPAKFRENLGESFVIFKSLRDKCIRVVSDTEWENYIAPIQKLPRELGENVMQALTDDAASVTPDSQGRIVIPQTLLDKVEITKNATVAGRGTYLEIWAEDIYAEKQAARDFASMLEQLSAYGL